jgi:hypothetical protein
MLGFEEPLAPLGGGGLQVDLRATWYRRSDAVRCSGGLTISNVSTSTNF